MQPQPTSIYHLTHIATLQPIVASGGLLTYNQLEADNQPTSIAHVSVQGLRAQRTVSCRPGGNLHDYVPFYFAPRPPMLYVMTRGAVAGIASEQQPLVYLVVEAEAVAQANLGFAFSDGHAAIAYSRFFDQLADLDKVDWAVMQARYVDWAVMQARYWADTAEDNDRKRRRQAEFLVHRFLSLALVREVGVLNQKAAAAAQAILLTSGQQPPVQPQPAWYY